MVVPGQELSEWPLYYEAIDKRLTQFKVRTTARMDRRSTSYLFLELLVQWAQGHGRRGQLEWRVRGVAATRAAARRLLETPRRQERGGGRRRGRRRLFVDGQRVTARHVHLDDGLVRHEVGLLGSRPCVFALQAAAAAGACLGADSAPPKARAAAAQTRAHARVLVGPSRAVGPALLLLADVRRAGAFSHRAGVQLLHRPCDVQIRSIVT